MNIKVNARHMDITQAMREYAEDKATKLQRFYDKIISIEVVLDTDGGTPTAEAVVIASRNQTFIAAHRGEDMYGCIDNAIHKVEERAPPPQGPGSRPPGPHRQDIAPLAEPAEPESPPEA